MHPMLDFAGFDVSAYRLFTIIAIIVGTLVATGLMARSGVRTRAAGTIATLTVFGGLVGARLWAGFAAEDAFWAEPDHLLALRAGNMAIYGGLAGAALAAIFATRLYGLSVMRIADCSAPAIGVGIALLRVGCFLTGCCFGTETDLPVGVTYPRGSLPALHQIDGTGWSLFRPVHSVHPVPIYEILAAMTVAVIALVLLRRAARTGMAIATVLGGYTAARLLIHPVRAHGSAGVPDWFEPLVYSAVLVAVLGWTVLQLERNDRRLTSGASLA